MSAGVGARARRPRHRCRGIEAGFAQIGAPFAATDVGRYLNFTETKADVATMFPPATLARLREVKAKNDPIA